jgi:hypothetical protein
MNDTYKGRQAFLVAGGGRWGRGCDLAEAKRAFTAAGGRLSGGYEIFEFGKDSALMGVDNAGRIHYLGPAPASRVVAARKAGAR